MNYLQAVNTFTRDELRKLAQMRGIRFYSYLVKCELAHRLFGLDASINRGLCQMNQLRRYGVPQPSDPKQWQSNTKGLK